MIKVGNGEEESTGSGLRREQTTSSNEPNPNRSPESGSDGGRDGSKSLRDSRTNGEGANRDQLARKEAVGGMLSQLRELQRLHLAYVRSHEKRLRARLTENLEHQDQILDKMRQLESAVMEFVEPEPQESESSIPVADE